MLSVTSLIRQRSLRRLLGASLSALLMLAANSALATVTTGSTTVPRMMHSATALADGSILLAGGYARPGTIPYASVERYDPTTGFFSAVAPMQQARTEHAAVTLKDGRVMVLGGSILTNPSLVGTAATEIFDPATGQWKYAANMNVSRSRAMARLLPSGKVFVMNADPYANLPYAEVYDPQTNTFIKTGNMINIVGFHGLVVLTDGRVLKVGGYGSSGYTNSAEIWNPATNQWTSTGAMGQTRQEIHPVLLPDGKVLVAGGRNTSALYSTEIYDPSTGQWLAGNPMPIATAVSSATTLGNGDIIVMGDFTRSLARYQTATGQWNLTGPKRLNVRKSTVSLLPSGDLLLVGGAEQNDANSNAAIWEKACSPQVITLSGSTSQTISGAGGQASFTVTAAPGCRFEISGLLGWLTSNVTGPQIMPASGSMVINFSAAENASGVSRTASFSLGNNPISIAQGSPSVCPTAPVLSPTSFSLSASATVGVLQITAGSTCPWSLSGLPSWVTTTSATSGTGNGSITLQIASNTGTSRSASALVTSPGYSNALMISQSAAVSCPSGISLSPSISNFSPTATSGSIQVSAASTCSWSVSGLPTWVIPTSGTSGTGNGSFVFQVAANLSTARSATIQASGPGVASTAVINQAAPVVATGCSAQITGGDNNGTLAAGCPVGARGAAYNTYRYTFNAAPGNRITMLLTSGIFDTYLYLRDPTGKVIAFDDDSGGYTNSRIPAAIASVFTLPTGSAGVYTIEVTSYSAGATGAFRLSMSLGQ
jgi:hypothetical protein